MIEFLLNLWKSELMLKFNEAMINFFDIFLCSKKNLFIESFNNLFLCKISKFVCVLCTITNALIDYSKWNKKSIQRSTNSFHCHMAQ